MCNKPRFMCLLSCGLALTLLPTVTAQVVHLGGPSRAGHARPPLYVNFGPFRGHGGGGGSVYYNPAQIRHAYGFDQITTTTGAGQTIALIDAFGSPSIQADLDMFCSLFSLPAATVDIRTPQGQPGANAGWAQETSLDVEWAHAIAPGASIMLVVSADSSFNNLLAAVDYAVSHGATVVSMSWGGGEFTGQTSADSHFNVSGVSFVAASGDGAEGSGVEWPASSPYVIGVGGTSLRLTSASTRSSETAWSSSGGGISAQEARPSWQSGWLSTSGRGVPDVSYVADPSTGVEVVYNGGLYVFGGTSVGAPQWAALVALANAHNSGALGSGGTALYSVAGTPDTINPAHFFDITSGQNGRNSDDKAVAGYDLVTGLGSPVANNLISVLR